MWVPFLISPIQIERNKFNNNHMCGIYMNHVWDPNMLNDAPEMTHFPKISHGAKNSMYALMKPKS